MGLLAALGLLPNREGALSHDDASGTVGGVLPGLSSVRKSATKGGGDGDDTSGTGDSEEELKRQHKQAQGEIKPLQEAQSQTHRELSDARTTADHLITEAGHQRGRSEDHRTVLKKIRDDPAAKTDPKRGKLAREADVLLKEIDRLRDAHQKVDTALDDAKEKERTLRRTLGYLRSSGRKKPGGRGGGSSGQGTPQGGSPDAGGSGAASGDGGNAKGKPRTPTDSAPTNAKQGDAYLRLAQENLKQAKDAKADPKKIGQHNAALEKDLQKQAKLLQSDPRFADLRGAGTKQFYAGVRSKFGGVRTGASNLVLLATNLADAYELMEQVQYILDSKSLSEALQKGLALGGSMVEGQITFGVLRFALRSTPAAIGVSVFLGDMDLNLGLSEAGKFDLEVAHLVNQVRPGSVDHKRRHDEVTNYKDAEAKALFEEARKQARSLLKDGIAKNMSEVGAADGLVGADVTKKFEVSAAESKILGITDKWMAQQFMAGYSEGARKRQNAVARAKSAGFKSGQAGKEADFGPLWGWPEIEALRQRDLHRAGKADFNFQRVFDRYKNSYDEGYREGRGGFDTRTLRSFRIDARSVSKEKYSREPLVASVQYSNGTSGVLSEEVTWSTDAPSVVTIAVDKRQRVAMAHLIGVGSAKVTGKMVSGGKTFEDVMSVSVKYPLLKIVPPVATRPVGDELRFLAKTEGGAIVPSASIQWLASPEGIVEMHPDGRAVMLKAGEAEISVFEAETSPVRATAKLIVV